MGLHDGASSLGARLGGKRWGPTLRSTMAVFRQWGSDPANAIALLLDPVDIIDHMMSRGEFLGWLVTTISRWHSNFTGKGYLTRNIQGTYLLELIPVAYHLRPSL